MRIYIAETDQQKIGIKTWNKDHLVHLPSRLCPINSAKLFGSTNPELHGTERIEDYIDWEDIRKCRRQLSQCPSQKFRKLLIKLGEIGYVEKRSHSKSNKVDTIMDFAFDCGWTGEKYKVKKSVMKKASPQKKEPVKKNNSTNRSIDDLIKEIDGKLN